MNRHVRNIVLSGMLLSVGLVLPFLTGQVQAIGNMLLPMHLPVLLCGLICGWKYGLAVGLILPPLRSLLFTMPQLYPNAIAMAFELAAYGFFIGLLFFCSKKRNLFTLYRSLVLAMLAGRAVWGIAQTLLLRLTGVQFKFSTFLAVAFVEAIPGIILQLILIPAIMIALDRTHLIPFEK